MSKDFLTVEDIAQELKISIRTARKLFRDKKIPGKKIAGKYITTREQLKKYIEDSEIMEE